jgi:hypothetical protein
MSSALGRCWDGSPATTEEFQSRDKRILTLQKETALDNFNAAMIGYYSWYVWLLEKGQGELELWKRRRTRSVETTNQACWCLEHGGCSKRKKTAVEVG